MTRLVFAAAFLLGAFAILAMGANFLASNALALVITLVIGGVYAIGAMELLRFQKATATLSESLAGLKEESSAQFNRLGEWLSGLHPSLHHSVRQRVEGERIALPAPVLTPYLVSLLVMLGLLGTFIGLVEALKGVDAALEDSSDLEAIRQALSAPIGGLGLAFGTSVAGVAASAMLGLMSTLSRHERVLATRELDTKISSVLRRFSHAHKQQETFEALQLQSQQLPEVADKLQLMSERVEHMTEKLSEQLMANQEGFHDSAKAMYGELAASVDKSLQGSIEKSDRVLAESGRLIATGIQPVVQEAMVAISTEVNQGLQTTHDKLSQTVQDQLQGISAAFSKTSAEVAGAWQDGLQAHGRSNDSLIKAVQTAFGDFSEKFAGASTQVLDSINRTTAQWSERQEAGEKAQLGRWTEALHQTQQQTTGQFADASKAIIGELQAVAQRQQAAMTAVTAEVTALSSELRTQLGQVAEQTAGQQQQVMTVMQETARSMVEDAHAGSSQVLSEIGQLLSASEALIQTRTASEAAWLADHEQRMEGLTTSLRSELTGLRDEEAKRGQAAVDRLGELETTVTANLATLGKALEEPMTHLIQVASETPRAAAEVIGKLRQEITNNAERDNELLQERSRVMADLDAVSISLAESSAGQVAAIERLVDGSAGLLQEVSEQFAQQVAGEVSKASEVADQVAVSMAEVSSLGEAFKVAVELYSSSNHQLTESLQRIEGALEKSTGRSDEQLAYYVAQAREVIDYSVGAQKEIFDELRKLKLDKQDDQAATEAD